MARLGMTLDHCWSQLRPGIDCVYGAMDMNRAEYMHLYA